MRATFVSFSPHQSTTTTLTNSHILVYCSLSPSPKGLPIQTKQAEKPEMAAYAAVISLKHTINDLLNPVSSSTLEMLESASDRVQPHTTFARILNKIIQSKLAKCAEKVAYAGAISLKRTINGLLNSSPITLSVSSSTPEMLAFAYNQATSLQQALERLNDSSSRKRVDFVDGQIRDAAHKLEDVLKFHQLSSQEEEVRTEIMSFVEAVKRMEKDYTEELSRPLTDEEEDDDDEEEDESDDATIVNFGVEMVGHSTLFNNILNHLLRKMRPIDSFFGSFHGENGSGRTASANAIFEEVGQFYDCCAWVTLGTASKQLKEVVIRILEQVDINRYELLLESEEEDEDMICHELYKALENRRYMIVLDDVRSVVVFERLRISFPDEGNGGNLVLVTTNKRKIAKFVDHAENFMVDGVEGHWWSMLYDSNFNNEHLSPELEEAGRKIVDNCRCRIISFFKTLLFLYKREKTVEEWRKIAADKEHPIFMVGDEISEMNEIKREMQSNNIYMDAVKGYCTVKSISNMSDSLSKYLKGMMHPERFFSKMEIICFVGMSGIGKTTFAKKIIQVESILCHFDHCVWVNIGPKYEAEEILIDILAQIYPAVDKMHMKVDEELVRELSSKRCLIVLDDLWSAEPLHHLKNLVPDIKGITLVTTTRADVAKFGKHDTEYEIPLLDEEESWRLLCKKVFAEGECPYPLEKAGRQIAENCEGLPLLILTVGDQLLKVERSQECWNNVASGKEKSVFMNAHRQISKALRPRYLSLPQHLKICFLYIGVFRQKYKIPTSDLTNLLIVEGFLETNKQQTMEEYVVQCLLELVQRRLVMVQHKAFPVSEFKTYCLHAVFWHLANREAMNNKFFHAINSYEDCSEEKMKSPHRLCIRNSILLGFKDVQDSMASITNAHSLLCVSPLQQYPVPIDFDMRLLRVMHAITIRLYEFPAEVVRLLHLTYLALTFNGKLPTSISSLWKLQYLIVSRYMNIKSSESCRPLPVEIWDMKELKHLQIMGGRLPHPKLTALLKLSTLLDVSAQSCTEEVLEKIPNLKRLGIRIEVAPDDDELLGDSFDCLNNVCCVGGLESLKCVVVNPQIRARIVPPPIMFPPNLKRLSLSGLGYPWEYMNSLIGGLQNLEVLKLKHYAFQGPKWELDPTKQFRKLKSLSVEDTNLVQWKLKVQISYYMEHLCFKHCYKLKELPIAANVFSVKNIEIVECSPFTVTWAEQVATMIADCKVKVHPIGTVARNHQE